MTGVSCHPHSDASAQKKPRRGGAKCTGWAAKIEEETQPTPKHYHRKRCTARGITAPGSPKSVYASRHEVKQ